MFLIKSDFDLLNACTFSRMDVICLCVELRILLFEQNEDYLVFLKYEKDQWTKKFLIILSVSNCLGLLNLENVELFCNVR